MPNKSIIILTGLIQSGKTTTLVNWAKHKSNVAGILSPIKKDERCFYNLADETYFTMQANENDKEVLTIGKFIFSDKAFKHAASQLIKGSKDPNLQYLIIDEIGPLELNHNLGFYNTLILLLKMNHNWNLILVVRLSMLQKMEALLVAHQQDFVVKGIANFID